MVRMSFEKQCCETLPRSRFRNYFLLSLSSRYFTFAFNISSVYLSIYLSLLISCFILYDQQSLEQRGEKSEKKSQRELSLSFLRFHACLPLRSLLVIIIIIFIIITIIITITTTTTSIESFKCIFHLWQKAKFDTCQAANKGLGSS